MHTAVERDAYFNENLTGLVVQAATYNIKIVICKYLELIYHDFLKTQTKSYTGKEDSLKSALW